MFHLGIDPEALRRYATIHGARHLATFETFGVIDPTAFSPRR